MKVGAKPSIVAMGLEHEEAGEAAQPVDVGEAGGLVGGHGGRGKIVADFAFLRGESGGKDNAATTESAEYAEKRKKFCDLGS